VKSAVVVHAPWPEIFLLYPTNKEMKIEEFQDNQNVRVRLKQNKQTGQVIIERTVHQDFPNLAHYPS
jgi:mannosyltransferase OCH1-like enzyme